MLKQKDYPQPPYCCVWRKYIYIYIYIYIHIYTCRSNGHCERLSRLVLTTFHKHVSSRYPGYLITTQVCVIALFNRNILNLHFDKLKVLFPPLSCQQPVNTTHDYTSCCLYRVDPPVDEQQACSKHTRIEAYY